MQFQLSPQLKKQSLQRATTCEHSLRSCGWPSTRFDLVANWPHSFAMLSTHWIATPTAGTRRLLTWEPEIPLASKRDWHLFIGGFYLCKYSMQHWKPGNGPGNETNYSIHNTFTCTCTSISLQSSQSRRCVGLVAGSRLAWSSFLSPEPQGGGQTPLHHKQSWKQSTETAHLWGRGGEKKQWQDTCTNYNCRLHTATNKSTLAINKCSLISA